MVTTRKSRNKPECFGISIEENKKISTLQKRLERDQQKVIVLRATEEVMELELIF